MTILGRITRLQDGTFSSGPRGSTHQESLEMLTLADTQSHREFCTCIAGYSVVAYGISDNAFK